MTEKEKKEFVEEVLGLVKAGCEDEKPPNKQKSGNGERVLRLIIINPDIDSLDGKSGSKTCQPTMRLIDTLRKDAPTEKSFSIADALEAVDHFSDAGNVLGFLKKLEFPSIDDVGEMLNSKVGEAIMFFYQIFAVSMIAWMKQNNQNKEEK